MNNEVATTNSNDFDISDFLSDPNKENEGVWFPLGKGREIKLARAKNDQAETLIRAKYRANRVVLEQEDDIATKLNEDLMMEVYAQAVIKGLRVNGNEVAYTPAVGLNLLKVRNLREKIYAYAGTSDAYKLAAEDTAVKS